MRLFLGNVTAKPFALAVKTVGSRGPRAVCAGGPVLIDELREPRYRFPQLRVHDPASGIVRIPRRRKPRCNCRSGHVFSRANLGFREFGVHLFRQLPAPFSMVHIG